MAVKKPKKSEMRQESKNELMKLLDDKYGKGIVRPLGTAVEVNVPRIPCSSVTLTRKLKGGIPLGRVVEIYGVNSGGKTTLALDFIKHAQEMGSVAFVDTEHTLDIEWAKHCGVDVDNLWFSQPDSGEQAIEIVRTLAASGQIKLIVIDSVAGLVPQSELDGEVGEAHMGKQAKMMSQAMRMLVGLLEKNKCTAIFINQTRKNMSGYGPNDLTTGGEALKFFASVRLEVKIDQALTEESQRYGHKSKITVVKNKSGGKAFEFTILSVKYGIGFDYVEELVDLAIEAGHVEKSGAWYSFGEVKKQGKEPFLDYLRENEGDLTKLRELVILPFNK